MARAGSSSTVSRELAEARQQLAAALRRWSRAPLRRPSDVGEGARGCRRRVEAVERPRGGERELGVLRVDGERRLVERLGARQIAEHGLAELATCIRDLRAQAGIFGSVGGLGEHAGHALVRAEPSCRFRSADRAP